ncbi:MAG: hypothetical protein JRG94_26015 [Deltaproteobacteria bacterium]|nr:hypothetical protein [Deltaproteobacteria bacterium]
MAQKDDEITLLLNRAEQSDRPADQLWELVYPELRRRARNLFRNERADHTLSATAVINEVFVRLTTASAREWQDRAHFYSAASGIGTGVAGSRALLLRSFGHHAPRPDRSRPGALGQQARRRGHP